MKRKQLLLLLGSILFPAFCAYAQDSGNGDKVIREVDCPADGRLEDVIGEDWETIDSLIVTGFVHELDFPTMNKCCVYGRLSGINLSGCQIENDAIPPEAFVPVDWVGRQAVRNLKYITFPESLKKISKYAFWSTGLKQITLPNEMEEIELEAFYSNRDAAGTLSIPEGVEEVPLGCFEGCWGITRLELPTTLKSIGGFSFYSMDLRDTLVIPEGVEIIGNAAFFWSHNLHEVILPSTLVDIGHDAFSGCRLTSIKNFPEGVGYIPTSCFFDCRLEYWEFPDDITLIDNEAFAYNCFHDLVLPDAVEIIGRWAFMGIGNLNSVRLPKSLKIFGEAAFVDCRNLTKVYAQNPEPPEIVYSADDMYEQIIGTRGVFANIHPKAVLYVPVGARDAYVREGWQEWFADIQEYDYAAAMSIVQEGEAVEVSRHALDGTPLSRATRGLNIVRMSDGTVRKVVVK